MIVQLTELNKVLARPLTTPVLPPPSPRPPSPPPSHPPPSSPLPSPLYCRHHLRRRLHLCRSRRLTRTRLRSSSLASAAALARWTHSTSRARRSATRRSPARPPPRVNLWIKRCYRVRCASQGRIAIIIATRRKYTLYSFGDRLALGRGFNTLRRLWAPVSCVVWLY